MYAGRYDFVIPTTVVADAYQKLTTPNKDFHIFEHSGHAPIGNEHESYLDRLRGFVIQYK